MLLLSCLFFVSSRHHQDINFTAVGTCVPRASHGAARKERIPFLPTLPDQVMISSHLNCSNTLTLLPISRPFHSQCPRQEFSTLKLECNWFCYNRSWAPPLPNPTLLYCLHWTCAQSEHGSTVSPAERPLFSLPWTCYTQTFSGLWCHLLCGWAGVPRGDSHSTLTEFKP